MLFVSFSVSGPSDNSVHGMKGISHESSFISFGIPVFSDNSRLQEIQARVNMNEPSLPFYLVTRSNQEPAYSNPTCNNGIGAGASAAVLTHFKEQNKTEGYY